MFDIPFELLTLYISIVFSFFALGIVWNPKIPALIMTAGLMIFPMIALTDNVIMGYSSSGGTLKITETQTPITIFADSYTNNTGWTQVSTGVDVDSTVSDKLAFNLISVSGDRRVHKSLGSTIEANDPFIMTFDFTFQSQTSANEYAVALTTSNNALSVAQDAIIVQYVTSTNTGLRVQSRDDGGAFTGCSTPVSMVSAGSTYYVTVERFNTQSIQLRVYSDSARSILIGSQLCGMASDTIGGFNTIQHSHNTGTTSFVAQIDNMMITGIETETIIETEGTAIDTPILYELTEYPKLMFGLVAMGLVFVGMLVYSKEK